MTKYGHDPVADLLALYERQPRARYFDQPRDHYMFRGDGTMEWDKVYTLIKNCYEAGSGKIPS